MAEFRCINQACGRTFPRAVRFCPYCGTAQAAQRNAAAAAAAAAPPAVTPPPPAPVPPHPPAPAPQQAQARPPAAPPPQAPAPPQAPPAAAPRPGPTQASGHRQPQPTVGVPRPPGSGIGSGPSRPPVRKPIGKGTWIVVGLLLLAIWFLVKPGDPAKKLDDKIDDAIALTENCRISDARAALAELRGAKASTAQLARLQKAITATAPACEKKVQRAKAWKDARTGVETALSAGSLEKASARLATFVKRWGDDDESRELRERVDARRGEKLLIDASACLERKDRACVEAKLDAAAKLRRPEMQPRIEALRESLSRMLESTLLEGQGSGQGGGQGGGQRGGQASQATPGSYPPPLSATPPRAATAAVRTAVANPAEARQLQAQAEREIGQGNYRSAIGLAGRCATLGSPECATLRDRATRLERELHACVQAGREWVGERCE